MKPQTNFDLVLFGATGDLAMRKLLPALYQAHAAGLLHPQGRILGVSRSKFSREEFLAKVGRDSKIHIKNIEDAAWAQFEQRIDYLSLDVGEAADFSALADKVNQRLDTDAVVVYLSTAPKFFAPVCEKLAAAGLNAPKVRIVLEKPLGTDLASCRKINEDVAAYFQENQIYRIDHYLGKEGLQNLLPLRFGNSLFEPLWNKDCIQSVQITIAETLGVEERGEFYDITGALRDMVQNHIVQMLCFTAMERPKSLAADDVRDEKLKVIQSLKPLNDIDKQAIRGQYAPSAGLNGYTQEHKVPAGSRTETYVAIKAEIDNPRWAGVPFYLRTGKRLAGRTADRAEFQTAARRRQTLCRRTEPHRHQPAAAGNRARAAGRQGCRQRPYRTRRNGVGFGAGRGRPPRRSLRTPVARSDRRPSEPVQPPRRTRSRLGMADTCAGTLGGIARAAAPLSRRQPRGGSRPRHAGRKRRFVAGRAGLKFQTACLNHQAV